MIYNQILAVMVQMQLEAAGMDVTVTADNVDTYLSQLGEAADALKDAAAQEAAKQAKNRRKYS